MRRHTLTFVVLLLTCLPALAKDDFPASLALYLGGEASPHVVEFDGSLYSSPANPLRVTPYDPVPAAGSLWSIGFDDWPRGMGMFDGGSFVVVDGAGGLYSTLPPVGAGASVPEPMGLAVLGGAIWLGRRERITPHARSRILPARRDRLR